MQQSHNVRIKIYPNYWLVNILNNKWVNNDNNNDYK